MKRNVEENFYLCTIRPFPSFYNYISIDTQIDHTNSRARLQQPLNQNEGTIHTWLNKNKECQSLIILSSSNCSRMGPFHDVKYHNVIKESIKKKNDSVIPIGHLLGPLGTALPIANFDSFCHFRTDNQIDQKLLIHTEPSNQPNQQPEPYALYGQKATGPGRSIQRYEHDTKANPWKYPLYQRKRNTT